MLGNLSKLFLMLLIISPSYSMGLFVDFDDIAVGQSVPPEFQPQWNNNQLPDNKGIIPPNGNYIYFAVYSTVKRQTNHFAPTRIGTPNQKAVVPHQHTLNIYFPTNGSQPSITDAVNWSGAAIANSGTDIENKAITDWYVKMFGVDKITTTQYIEAGYNSPHAISNMQISAPGAASSSLYYTNIRPTRIISINAKAVQTFKRNFRQIASTSTGRVLLYRILIEIRRGTRDNGNIEMGIIHPHFPTLVLPADIDDRNANRSISIIDADQDIGYSYNYARHTIAVEYPAHGSGIYTTLMGIVNHAGGYTDVACVKESSHASDTALFHEMLHWFHRLRNNIRCDNEVLNYPQLNSYYVGTHYWGVTAGAAQQARHDVSAESWSKIINLLGVPHQIIDFEEIRTVYGDIRGVNGDDLSENLYRVNVNIPRRIGYDNISYYEDNGVVNQIIQASNTFGIYDHLGHFGPPPPPNVVGVYAIGFQYAQGRQGLGACRRP